MDRIMVFGIGGIGGYVGARIGGAAGKTGGPAHSLAFIARGPHLAAIASRGLRFRNPDGAESVVRPSIATDQAPSAGPVDLVFLCVKGYDLERACRSLAGSVGEGTVVVPLLNGADIHERVRSVIKTGIVLPAAIYISSSVAEPGLVVQAGGAGNLVLGRDPGRSDYDPSPLFALLDAAGIPYKWFDDPFPAIWTKYLFIASFGLVTGRTGLGIGEVMADPVWAEATKSIQREIAALAAAKGVALPPDAAEKAFSQGGSFPAKTTTSYQRDLAVPGKPNEGELFGGTIMRLGAELGVPTPVAERVYGEILAGEK